MKLCSAALAALFIQVDGMALGRGKATLQAAAQEGRVDCTQCQNGNLNDKNEFEQCNFWGDPHYTASWGPTDRFDYQGLGVYQLVNNSVSCESFQMQSFHCQYRTSGNSVTTGVAFLLNGNVRVFMNNSYVSVTPGFESVTGGISGPITNAQLQTGVNINAGDGCNFANIYGKTISGKPEYILSAKIRAYKEVDQPEGICGSSFLASTFVADSENYIFTDDEFQELCTHCSSFGGTGSPGCPGVPPPAPPPPVVFSDRCAFAEPDTGNTIQGFDTVQECAIDGAGQPVQQFQVKETTATLESFDNVCLFFYDSNSGGKNCDEVCSALGTTCNTFLGRVGASAGCTSPTNNFDDCDTTTRFNDAICACNIPEDFNPNPGQGLDDVETLANDDPGITYDDAVGNCTAGWLENVTLPPAGSTDPLTEEQFNLQSCIIDWVLAAPEDRDDIVEIAQASNPNLPINSCLSSDGGDTGAPETSDCTCGGIVACSAGEFCDGATPACLDSCSGHVCSAGTLKQPSAIPCAASSCTDDTCCDPPAPAAVSCSSTDGGNTGPPEASECTCGDSGSPPTCAAGQFCDAATPTCLDSCSGHACSAGTLKQPSAIPCAASSCTDDTCCNAPTPAPNTTCGEFQCQEPWMNIPSLANKVCKPFACDTWTCCYKKRNLRRRRRRRNGKKSKESSYYNDDRGTLDEIQTYSEEMGDELEDSAFLQTMECEEGDADCEEIFDEDDTEL